MVAFIRNLSIKQKVATILAILIAIFLVTTLYAYYTIKSEITGSIESELLSNTKMITAVIQKSLDVSIKNYLRGIAEKNVQLINAIYKDYKADRLTENQAKQKAARLLMDQTIGSTGYIYCINSHGMAVVHPNPDVAGNDYSYREFIQQQIALRNGYLEYDWRNPDEPAPRPKALYMAYFEPWDWIVSVSSYRNEFAQLVSVDDFRDTILNIRFGKSGYSFVMDSKGDILIHPTLSGNVNELKIKDAQALMAKILNHSEGVYEYDWRDPYDKTLRKKIVAVSYLKNFDWYICSSGYLDELYRPVQIIRNIGLTAILASVFLVILVFYALDRSISRPINRLLKAIKTGESPERTPRPEFDSKDEIGELASNFNSFLDRISAYNKELTAEIDVRRQAEEDLRASKSGLEQANRMFRLVLDTIPVRVFWKDTSMRFLGCNRLFARDAGMQSPDELVGLTDRDMPWIDESEDYRSKDMEILQHRLSQVNFEETQTTPDGRRIHLRTSKALILDADGNLMGLLGTYEDITAEKHQADELRRLRLLMRNIIESMPSILIGVDLKGIVTLWNRGATDFTGVMDDQAVGRSLDAVFPQIRGVADHVAAAVVRREVTRGERLIIEDDSGARTYEVTLYPLTGENVEGAVIRLDDVTERDRIQEMMVQTEKMMSVGGLAAGMAHEINNPLGIIIQTAQNAINRFSPDVPKNREVAQEVGVDLERVREYMEQRKITGYLQAIREAGERAARIVRSMLDFSRKSESRFTPCDINALIDRTLELARQDYDMKKRYDFRKIAVSRRFGANLPTVWCSQTEIEQVILNLLKNSAHAMAEQTPEKPPEIRLETRVAGPMVEIVVEDNGPGMDETTRRRAFEPFFTTKETGVGTGLGLSVSYYIVTANHSGEMAVESSPGAGARFVVRLPISRTGGAA